MKKLLLYLFLMFYGLITYSSTSIDSIRSLIHKDPSNSELKLELAERYLKDNKDSAQAYLNELVKQEPLVNEVNLYAHLLLAELYEEELNAEKAMNEYMIVLHQSLKLNKPEEATSAYTSMGIIHIGNQHYAKATDYFNKAAKLNKETSNNGLQASIYSNLAIVHKLTGQLDQYQHYLLESKKLKHRPKKIKNKTYNHTKENSKIIIPIILLLLLIVSSLLGAYLLLKYKNYKRKLHKLQLDNELQRESIEKKSQEINTISEHAEKINGYKSEFLANISHEIRTPLNAITGYINLLQKQIDPKQTNTYIHNALIASGNLGIIINDLLDISRIEAGKMVIENTSFNPIQIVTHAISTLKLKAEEQNIAIDLHFDPLIPENLMGDPYRLSQILINLINNAIKFSEAGTEVSISVKCQTSTTDCELGFSIVDKGVGIAEDQLENIFESFTQISSNTARNQTGTGMGLAIVKRLVELQNGDINVESKLNEGSKFSFDIAYQIDLSEELTNSSDNNSDSKTISSIKECHVLLVEDNEINQHLATDTILSWEGNYSVDIAGNGKIALEMLNKNKYDVVLMDIQMPVMDGHEATIQIRKSKEPIGSIPIIGMTAHALPHEKDLAFKNGMSEYIIKPFNPDELQQKINSFVIKNTKRS